jgi:hypothetical protein
LAITPKWVIAHDQLLSATAQENTRTVETARPHAFDLRHAPNERAKADNVDFPRWASSRPSTWFDDLVPMTN